MLTTTKPPKCRYCKERTEGLPLHDDCIAPWLQAQNAKKAAARQRVERKADREKRQAIKPRAKWLAECQAIVNKLVRLRDLSLRRGCFTCGATPDQKFGGTYDAGHFRSVGSAPHLRFWMPQIALQCIPCNRHRGGQALAFRRALVEKRGVEWVEALEAMHHVAKFDIPYLIRFKSVMGKRLRRMEKRIKGEFA